MNSNLEAIPIRRNGEKAEGFVYFAKIGKNPLFCPNRCDNLYKIGYTKDVKKRMGELREREGVRIELLACGYSKKVRLTEAILQGIFYKATYSFLYRENHPRWSNEYFQFGDYHTIKIIEQMKIICEDCVVFHPRPTWTSDEEYYQVIDGVLERVGVETT